MDARGLSGSAVAAGGPVDEPARAAAPAARAATVPVLVEADWVAEHLHDPDVVLVEVDREAATYHWLHIPGAVSLDWVEVFTHLLRPEPEGTEAFAAVMSRLGIEPGAAVVLYGDWGNQFAASALWLLRYHGHQRLHLLNGGRDLWVAQGRELTDEETVRERVHYPAAPVDPSVRATRDDVLAQLAGAVPAGLLVDCRSEEEFGGRSGPGGRTALSPDGRTSVPGHVPGAVNLPPRLLLDERGALLPADDLSRRMSDHGVTPDRQVVAYCQLSERSSLTWVALHEVLGYQDVRVYDGGWWEYSHLVGVPVQQGVHLAPGVGASGA